jgi:hypothetical protein
MPRYRNGDVNTRVWTHLTNPKTGSTLELAPDEEVTLKDPVDDVHLVLVKAKGRVELAPEPEKDKEDV